MSIKTTVTGSCERLSLSLTNKKAEITGKFYSLVENAKKSVRKLIARVSNFIQTKILSKFKGRN